MKGIKLAVGAAFAAALVLQVQAQSFLTNGLVAYYPFNGNATDESGNGNNGVVNGAVLTTDRLGEPNSAYQFNGSSSVINFSSPPLTVVDNWTLSAWINSADLTQTGFPILLGFDNGSTGNGYGFGFTGTSTLQGLLAGVTFFDSGYSMAGPNQWHHVVMLRDNGITKVFVDGTQTPNASPATPATPTTFTIGSRSGNYFFKGAVDDVRIYSRALSSNEVVQLYVFENTPQPPSIISQPRSQVVEEATPASLAVKAQGLAPLSYQWRLYGTNIAGATSNLLAVPSAQITDAGIYSVVISNSLGSVTSSNAVLQVLPHGAPSIQVNGELAVGTVVGINSAQVSISGGFSNGFIFYTLDGSVPSVSSTLYTGAFTLTNSATVQAMSLSADFSQTAVAPAVQVLVTTVYSLQTSIVGSGSIAVNPPNGPYLSNSVVTLTATPAMNWLFDHWEGDATGRVNQVSLVMDRARTAKAVFLSIPVYGLQTSVVGNGSVSVAPAPGPYLSNSVVTLTAAPGANWLFDHWEGDASGSANPVSVTMNGPRTVTAVFVQTYPVTVSTPGGGAVTVNGQVIPPATYYASGTPLDVLAVSSTGWSFLGWRGDASGTNNPFHLIVNQAKNIQATFGTVVGTNPLGAGSIVLSQPNPVPYGTVLTVSAVPASGRYFVAWNGAASGATTHTTITVTSNNPTISALFTTLPGGKYSLAAVVVGGGAVSVSPQQNYYNPGDSVTLTATPTPGASAFYGWSGDASGTNLSVTIVMNTNKVVQANFGALPEVSIVPQNQVVLAGSNAVLTANAAGLPPLRYQWQKGQTPLLGATNVNYYIIGAQAADSDIYSVIVSNPFGSVTSSVATVTVVYPPSIDIPPLGQTLPAGNPMALQVTAKGTQPLSYQWQWNGADIANATNETYSVIAASTNDIGNYSVVVTNPYGAVTSAVAPVFVYIPVSVTSQPVQQVVPFGHTATFSVGAYGYPAPSYQWTFNGAFLADASGTSLMITNVSTNKLGNYSVIVWNSYSVSTSSVAPLLMAPSLSLPFTGLAATWGKSATLSVAAVGSGELSYQWFKDGAALSWGTNSSLAFPVLQLSDAGLYWVVVSSPWGNVTNAPAQVVVNPAGVSLGLCPSITISGVVGYNYIIQSTPDLRNTNAWVTLTNLTLEQPVQLWVDTNVDASLPANPYRFYRVLPGQ